MFEELLSVFRSSDPLRAMAKNFEEMLALTREMTTAAGDMFFSGGTTPQARTELYARDVRVNQLQREIRKQVVAHLSLSGHRPDVPHSLLLVSLVKDVERIGDYAKNPAEVTDIRPGPPPDDEITAELLEIRREVEGAFAALLTVFGTSNRAHAVEVIRRGGTRRTGATCSSPASPGARTTRARRRRWS